MRFVLFCSMLGLLAGCSPVSSNTSPTSESTPAPKAVVETGGQQPANPSGTPSPDTPVSSKTEAPSPTPGDSKPAKPVEEVPNSSLFQWAFTREDGLAKAKKSGGYVLLKFEASWCGPCQIMKREAFQDAEVAKTLKKAIVVPIDSDTEVGQKLSVQYNVESIPMLVFLKPNGQVFGTIIGYMDVSWLQREIHRVFERAEQKG